MVDFGETVKRIDQLLKTKLDELLIVLVVVGLTFALAWAGKIGEVAWGSVTSAVIAAWAGASGVRARTASLQGRKALEQAEAMLKAFVAEKIGGQSGPPPNVGPSP